MSRFTANPQSASKVLDLIPDGAGSINTGQNLTVRITKTAHGFSVGNALRFNGTSWVLAKADNLNSSQSSGIVTEVISANRFELTLSGRTDKLSGLVAGTTYYLSPTVSGSLTAVRPNTIGQFVKPMLYALTESVALIDPGQSLEIGSSDYDFGNLSTTISPVGQICPFGGTTAPANWIFCDGTAISKTEASSQYAELYSTIGNTFYVESTLKTRSATSTGLPIVVELSGGARGLEVGDVVNLTFTTGTYAGAVITTISDTDFTIGTTFGATGATMPAVASTIQIDLPASSDKFFLPDLRGRGAIGKGLGDGLTNRNLGSLGGEEAHLLTEEELPSHNHTLSNVTSTVLKSRAGADLTFFGATGSTNFTGEDTPHNVMQPYLVTNFIIRAIALDDALFVGATGPQGPTGSPGDGNITSLEIFSFERSGAI